MSYQIGQKVVLKPAAHFTWEHGEMAEVVSEPLVHKILRGPFYEVKPLDKRKKPRVVHYTRIKSKSELPDGFKLITGVTLHVGLFDVEQVIHYKEVEE